VLGACAAHGLQLLAFDAPLVVALPALEVSEGMQPCICHMDAVLLSVIAAAPLPRGLMCYVSAQKLRRTVQRCGHDLPLGQPSTAGWHSLPPGRWPLVQQPQHSAKPQHQASSAASFACCANAYRRDTGCQEAWVSDSCRAEVLLRQLQRTCMTETVWSALQAPDAADPIAHQHAADALSAALQHPVLLQCFCNPACPPQWLTETAQLLSAVLLAAEQSHESAAGATAVWAVTAHRLCRPYLIK
jgi:hypothetical protein